MEPRIQNIEPRKLTGVRLRMSLEHNRTATLWKTLMPRRQEIGNKVGNDLYSVQVYDDAGISNFTPATLFDKWAAVAVTNIETVPEGMESFILPGGLYAVFDYKGPASAFAETFRYIFETWLPQSAYELDSRPHFALMGEKYRNEHPDSEEEIWVPVKPRTQS